MFDETSIPAYIKIEEDEIGSCYAIQGFGKVQEEHCPDISLRANIVVDTIWEDARIGAVCIPHPHTNPL